MPPTATNGNMTSARDVLDTLRQHIDRLEAEVSRQQQEIEKLRAERTHYRMIAHDYFTKEFGGPEAWDDFDAND